MLCDGCGTENRTGSRFCDHCGAPLSLNCSTCSEPNRADALFCAGCGSSLKADTPQADSGPSAERRQVSVLFADLVGFTKFADGLDPERVQAVQQEYFGAANEVVTRHGGTIEKFIGDAVMAVWGTPVAHEDDVQRAVRAGLEVVMAVQALGHDLDARAGIVTAEAAVTIGATNQGMVAGDMVNTAARLQAAAESGQVLADSATVQAASGVIAFEAVDDLALKGKSGPVRAWRAQRVLHSRAGDLVEPPFVGRTEELRRLKDLLHTAGRDRRIRLVSITGPAGIGKSRLVEELGHYAHGLAETTYWHTGRSPSYGEGLAFWALGEMVRRRTGLAEGDDEETTRSQIATSLEELVPTEEHAWIEPALLALLGSGDVSGAESMFPAWRTFFERIAERGTVVLVFEDLQWSDSGTLEFIEHLLDWSRNQPILVVTLVRPEFLAERPGWGTARSNSTAMTLEPMSHDEMRDLLVGVLPGLPEPQIETIVRRTEGMPLYAVEMVRALLADGRIERRADAYALTGEVSDLPLPASLRSLIASRLDALDSDDRALLQHGSVLGLSFSADALVSIAGRPAAELEPRLRALVRRELLEIEADPRSPERGQYRFVQSLIHEVAYGTLAMRERRARHLAAARYLETLESDEAAGALASHYLSALRASDEGPEADTVAAQARVSLRAAADRAASLGAHAQAVRNLEHAISITASPRDRAELLERAAISAQAAYLPNAPEYGERTLEAYRGIGDAHEAGKAAALLADIWLDYVQFDRAVGILQEGISRLEGGPDPEVEARLFSGLARAFMRLDRNQDAIEAADRALRASEALRLEEVTAAALVNKGAAVAGLSRNREAAALIEGGLRLAATTDLRHLELRAASNLASVLVEDDPMRSLQVLIEGAERSRRVGDQSMFGTFATIAGGIRYCRGTPEEWDAGTHLLEEWIALTDSPIDRLRAVGNLISYVIARGEDSTDMLRQLESDASTDPEPGIGVTYPALTRSEIALAQQQFADAVTYARRAVEAHRWAVQIAGPILAHAATRDRDVESLRWLSSRARDSGFVGTQSEAIRARIDGALLAMEGDHQGALEAFRGALERYARLELWWEWARTALDALAAVPDESIVREWGQEARQIFERLGAHPFVALTDALAPGPGTEMTEARTEAAPVAPA